VLASFSSGKTAACSFIIPRNASLTPVHTSDHRSFVLGPAVVVEMAALAFTCLLFLSFFLEARQAYWEALTTPTFQNNT
jgi:hypothetical protein